MITQITNSNRDQYAKLFEKARTALNLTNENDLNSLDLYFSRIVELANKDPHFTVLPLDEKPFDIDANKRTIDIPENFTANGLCVQGDESAEVVFFSIDRYFDSIDLNTQQIAIQWERPDGVIGISPEYIRDITSKEGKLLFGWVLDSEITAVPGKIKFSVRFYRLATEGDSIKDIEYSFSTLTATATVQPALDLNLTDQNLMHISKEDLQNLMISRLVNSTNKELPIPKAPIFAGVLNTNLDKSTNATILIEDTKDHNKTTYKGFADIKNLYVETDGSDVEHFYLWAYADVTGSTSNATYTWKKLTKQADGSFNTGEALSNVTMKYLSLTELNHGDAKINNGAYYIKTEDYEGNETYSLVEDEDLGDYSKDELFRKVSCAEITEEGIYRVIAKTVVGAGEGLGSVQSETIKNPYLTFYFFKPREIASLNDKDLLDSDTMPYEPYDVGYTSINPAIPSNATVTLKTKVVKTLIDETDVEWAGLLPLDAQYHLNAAADAAEEMTYQWYKETGADTPDTLMPGMTGSTLTLNVGTSGNFAEAVGYYKVIAKNKRNNSVSASKTNRYRVTYLPTAPSIAEDGDLNQTFATLGTTELTFSVKPTSDFDKVYCEWYVTDENKTTFTAIPNTETVVNYDSTKEEYLFSFTPIAIEGLIDGGEYIVAKSWVELNTKTSDSVVSSVAGVMNN